MKFSTIVTLVASALALAVVTALLPFNNDNPGNTAGLIESPKYSFPITSLDENNFSLPQFISINRKTIEENNPSGDTQPESETTNLISRTTSQKVQRTSRYPTSVSITQKSPSNFDKKFGSTITLATLNPAAELKNLLLNKSNKKELVVNGIKIDLNKPIALKLKQDNNNENYYKNADVIQVVSPNEINPENPSIYDLLDNSVDVVQADQVTFDNKPESLKIYDMLQPGGGQYFALREFLLDRCESGQCNKEELKGAGFLLMNEGKYDEAREIYAQINSGNFLGSDILEAGATDGNINCKIEGRVIDTSGKGIKQATVKILGTTNEIITDNQGDYSIELAGLFDLYKVRVNATKTGYNTATIPIDLITSDNLTVREITGLNFILESPTKSVLLNNQDGTVSGEDVWIEDNNFIVTTDWNHYEIPFDSLTYADGIPFLGEVEAFLFEFDKSSDIDQLLKNDIFDDVAGYAGDIMKTFGMPFILLIDTTEGKTIHVLKSNPMILQSKIMEMEALRTNADEVYEPLTNADLDFLKTVSDESAGYPIDRLFLIENELVRFPCFWVYDQLKGVWENINIKLISTDGIIETIFYTLNDVD